MFCALFSSIWSVSPEILSVRNTCRCRRHIGRVQREAVLKSEITTPDLGGVTIRASTHTTLGRNASSASLGVFQPLKLDMEIKPLIVELSRAPR